jgi:AcrR family transcriptional regulator
MRLSEDGVREQKRKILQAAFKVFSDEGFEAAKMEDIARLAGISRSPLYYYYNNKYQLFIEMYENYCDTYTANCIHYLAQSCDFFQNIENFFRFLRAEFYNGVGKISADVLSDIQGLEEANECNKKVRRTVFNYLVEQIKDAIKDGTLNSNADPVLIADIIHLIGEGLNSEGFMNHKMEQDGIALKDTVAIKKHIGLAYENILIKESIKMLKKSFGANNENID